MSEFSVLRVFERAFPDRLLLEKNKCRRTKDDIDITVTLYALYDGSIRGKIKPLGFAVVIENGFRVRGSEKELFERGESTCAYFDEMYYAYKYYETLTTASKEPDI